MQEVKEPWCKVSGAAGLWVFPKLGLGLGLNMVGFWVCAGTLCCCVCQPCPVPAMLPFLLPRRMAAGPRRSLFNSMSHKFIMLIYHTGPSIFDSGHWPTAALLAEVKETVGGGLAMGLARGRAAWASWGCAGTGLERRGLLLQPCKPASSGTKP